MDWLTQNPHVQVAHLPHLQKTVDVGGEKAQQLFPLVVTPSQTQETFPSTEALLEWLRSQQDNIQATMREFGAILFRGI